MIDKERLEKGLYWQKAWKLVEGCTKVSPGCDNCWSEQETGMRAYHPNEKIKARARSVTMLDEDLFNGHVLCREDNLDLPLRTRKPTVFSVWNDLFHEDVPLEFLTEVMVRMDRARLQGHTFLVLTKRAEAMADYLCTIGVDAPEHIWWGVTAENQEQADARIPHLLNVPGKRFLSVEPMLSAIDLSAYFGGPYYSINSDAGEPNYNFGIDAVLLGGESGKNARPMHPDWARSVRDQCAAAGISYYHKQNGEWIHCGMVEDEMKYQTKIVNGAVMCRVGKKKAGRTLDGKLHDALPWGKP